LQEQKLADEFGVSRTVVRAALANLAQRGLVQRTPNRGSVVTRIESGEAFYIYDVREVLEGLCARLATKNAAPDHWDDLIILFGNPMEQLIKSNEIEEFMDKVEVLRMRIIAAAANPILEDMLSSIRDKMYEIGRRIIILPGRAEQGLKEHRRLLEAMKHGDEDAAEMIRRQSVRTAREYLRRYERFVL
jgi:DNA-binding GntR family transcriptional regulator